MGVGLQPGPQVLPRTAQPPCVYRRCQEARVQEARVDTPGHPERWLLGETGGGCGKACQIPRLFKHPVIDFKMSFHRVEGVI